MRSLLLSISFLLFFASEARSDAIPPGTFECQGKQAGDACTVSGAVGTCQSNSCSHNMCLNCIPAIDSSARADGGAPPHSGSSGCSLGGRSTVSLIAPWLMAGTFSLLVLSARRRRSH
jgi:hypothetical protein